MLAAGPKTGGNPERIEKERPKHHELPFDSDRKRSAIIRRKPDGKLRAFVNGAPDVLQDRCTKIYGRDGGVRPLTDQDRQSIVAQNAAMAEQEKIADVSPNTSLGYSNRRRRCVSE